MNTTECYSCQMLAGERTISPGERIYDGRFWVIEHAYPTRLVGWLVLVLKRHAESLQELSPEEACEMGELARAASRAICGEMGCPKTYMSFYAEMEHFHHVHVHIIPRAEDLPSAQLGPAIFGLPAIPLEDERSTARMAALSGKLRRRLSTGR